MSLQVDLASPTPLHYQTREQPRPQIMRGELQPLASGTQIGAECGVSRTTVRIALTQLTKKGLVLRCSREQFLERSLLK